MANPAASTVTKSDVESGTVVLIGATTENPSFAVNAAVLSRARVFRLDPLEDADIVTLLERALSDERGLASRATAEPTVLLALAQAARGDARDLRRGRQNP